MNDGGFTRKKVESLTLGEKLRKIRSEFRTSLGEISRATRIQVKYLEYLESGNYEKLPADVYIKGFLRSYARHFSIEESALLRLYEKERHIRQNLGQERVLHGLEPRKPVQEFRFLFTTKGVFIVLTGIVIFGSALYLYREFRAFAAEPFLEILQPSNGDSVMTDTIDLVGKTDARTNIFVNDEELVLGPQGEFTERLVLRPGTNVVRVAAVNRFGKKKEVSLTVKSDVSRSVGSPEAFREQSGADNELKDEFSFEVFVREKSRVSVESDGMLVFSGMLLPDDRKIFQAHQKIVIRSENGKETFARIGNADFFPLSEENRSIDREFLSP